MTEVKVRSRLAYQIYLTDLQDRNKRKYFSFHPFSFCVSGL